MLKRESRETRLIPDHLKLVVALTAFELVVLFFARVVFYLVFRPDEAIGGWTIARAFYVGGKFDLRLILTSLVPLTLFGGLRRFGINSGRLSHRIWIVYLLVVQALLGLSYGVDFGYFAYVHNRVNATAIGFLVDAAISLQMVWETYPVVRGAIALATYLFVYWFFVRFAWRKIASHPPQSTTRWRRVGALILVVLAYIGGLFGKFSWYPLRWSDAFFTTDAFVSSLALNPVLFFVDTLKNKEKGFDIDKTKQYYPTVAAYLGVPNPSSETLSFTRPITGQATAAQPPNVIIVLLESFVWHHCGIGNNPLDPSPNLDAISRDGILFNNFYTPSFGTARSVFALTTGIPDVETHETSSRNPLIVKQHTLINAFVGYEKFYFLGGSLTWGNIRGLLSHNIPGLRIFEEGSYSAKRVDGWGISDLSLFEEANRVFDSVGNRPIFAILQTSGNHRPYTIPKDNRGFAIREEKNHALNTAGFLSNDEFNSFRLLDHDLGVFINDAKTKPWFANTIFVFLGDHGYRRAAAHTRPGEEELGLTRFHVPLVIYGPGVIKTPRTDDHIASELDVLPTLLGLLQMPGINTALGRNLLDPQFEDTDYAFTIDDQSTAPEIGLLTPRYYLRIFLGQDRLGLYDLTSPSPTQDLADQAPGVVQKLEPLCRGLYETARYLRYHNPPLPADLTP